VTIVGTERNGSHVVAACGKASTKDSLWMCCFIKETSPLVISGCHHQPERIREESGIKDDGKKS
jgi:hypothetical protein